VSGFLELIPPIAYAVYFAAFVIVFFGLIDLRTRAANRARELAVSRAERERLRSPLYRARPYLRRIVGMVERLEVGRRWTAEGRRRWSKTILEAGLSDELTGDELLAMKVAALVAALVVLPLFTITQPLILLVVAVVAYFLPDLWVRDQVRARSAGIARSLPDTLDTISLMLQAGLGFGQAVDVYAETAEPSPLLSEIVLASKQMRLGRTRSQVLANMASRADCLPLTHFATAVIQSERMGTSIGETLLTQANEMRQRRFQRAEELGQKAPVKMLGPLLLLVLPNVFIVLFAPMLLKAMAS
jgi:tight adherence protein C